MIIKIVITGGPCAGKSSAMQRIKEEISAYGYKVLFLPEIATELYNCGITACCFETNMDYQICQMKLQKEKETVFDMAARSMKAEKILIVCDRGAFDNKAYMSDEDFSQLLVMMGKNEKELRKSYDAVFHLVSVAVDAPEFYTTSNNNARQETLQEAAELDRGVLEAWKGHPYLRVIGNSKDFEGKLDSLIKEIISFLKEQESKASENLL